MNSFGAKQVLGPGQIISGRWEQKSYKVIRMLGLGGTAQVYLVQGENGHLRAMKTSPDIIGITHEHRILCFLNHSKPLKRLGIVPAVYELDDFQRGREVYHYIITDYCSGTNLGKYKGKLNASDIAVIGKKTAEFLSCLHETGFIFGDLKPGNILYDFNAKNIYITDFGSVSMKGHFLKQFTPGYDRVSWRAGTRMADEQYDIFSLGMLLTTLKLGKIRGRSEKGTEYLVSLVTRRVRPESLQKVILKALRQETQNCGEIALALGVVSSSGSAAQGSGETAVFVNVVGTTSVISFILSLIYYYH